MGENEVIGGVASNRILGAWPLPLSLLLVIVNWGSIPCTKELKVCAAHGRWASSRPWPACCSLGEPEELKSLETA